MAWRQVLQSWVPFIINKPSKIHVPVDIKSSQASRDETSGLQGRPDIHVGHECLSILNEVNGYEIGYQILNKIIKYQNFL